MPRTKRSNAPKPKESDAAQTIGADTVAAKALVAMNFRVTARFRREFKLYAVQRGMSMVDLLQESFKVFKNRRVA